MLLTLYSFCRYLLIFFQLYNSWYLVRMFSWSQQRFSANSCNFCHMTLFSVMWPYFLSCDLTSCHVTLFILRIRKLKAPIFNQNRLRELVLSQTSDRTVTIRWSHTCILRESLLGFIINTNDECLIKSRREFWRPALIISSSAPLHFELVKSCIFRMFM